MSDKHIGHNEFTLLIAFSVYNIQNEKRSYSQNSNDGVNRRII